jgi:hypothetical protein
LVRAHASRLVYNPCNLIPETLCHSWPFALDAKSRATVSIPKGGHSWRVRLLPRNPLEPPIPYASVISIILPSPKNHNSTCRICNHSIHKYSIQKKCCIHKYCVVFLSLASLALSTFDTSTYHRELREAQVDSDFDRILARLLSEWYYTGASVSVTFNVLARGVGLTFHPSFFPSPRRYLHPSCLFCCIS